MLEEAWLCEMAYPIKKAKQICEGAADLFMVHLCKCFLFSNTQWYDHWLKEAANYCIRCDDIRLKPDAKRPTINFFLADNMICEEIETASDAKQYLNLAIDKCPEIGREDANNDEALRFLDMWIDLRIELADMMVDEDTFNRDEYKEVIDEAIKRNI